MYRLGNGADDIRDAKNVRVLFFALKKIIIVFEKVIILSPVYPSLPYCWPVLESVNYISYVTDNSLECCPY